MDKAVALVIKVSSDAKGVSAGIDGATTKVSKLGKAGQVAGKLLAAGLLIAVGAAIKFTAAAAEDAAAQTKLAQTAQQVAGATDAQTAAMEDWISAQGKALGVTDDELRPALDKLITATGDVEKSQKLAAIAMDVSARTGKSLDSVSQALAKAQNGSVAGLGKYGIATKDAAGKTKDLATIQQELADKYSGAAASAADTAAGKQKKLQVAMGELQEEIGTKLLPIMSKLVQVGLDVVDWIDKNQTAAAAIIGTLGGLLAIIKIISVVTKAYTAIQTALNIVMAANPVVLIVIALAALAVALVVAYKKSETFRAIVDAAFGAIQKVVGVTVDFIRDHWRLIISIIGGPIGLAVALVTKHWDTIKAGGAAVVDWVREKWPALKTIVTSPIESAKAVLDKVWDNITGAFDTAKKTMSTIADGIKTALTAPFDAISSVVQGVIDKVQNLIDKILSIPGIPGGDKGTAVKGNSRTAAVPLPTTSRSSTVAPAPTAPAIHLHLDGFAFVGDEDKLARELKRLLGDELRRLGVAA